MNFTGRTTRKRFYFLCFLTAFLAVSCSSAESEPASLQIPPPSPSTQPVEYGASLSEWEEATQTETAQTASRDDSNTTEENEPGGYPAPEMPQVASSSDGYSGPGLEGNQPENGSQEPENAALVSDADGVASNENPAATTIFTLNDVVYQQIMWDALIPADFTVEAIMAKYGDQLAQIQDGSSEAADLYIQMQAEFNNAPVNEDMDGSLVRLPGFIAPLEYTDELITEFLLVPYFGACIHVPPPPANQTVLVKLSEGEGITFEDSYYPFWVMGQLVAEGASTDLAQAGYYIENALVEPYSDGY